VVNPAICRKCPRCKGIELPVRDEDALIAEAAVHCGLGDDLVVSSSLPEGCPYELEHTLLQEQTEALKEGWDDERRAQVQKQGGSS